MNQVQERALDRLAARLFASEDEPTIAKLRAHALTKGKGDFVRAQAFLNSWNSLRVRGTRGDTGCEDRYASILASAGVR